jgi:hypothetical protein
LRARLWRVVDGPEWAEAVEAADPSDEYFQDNLEAMRQALELGPYHYTHPYIEERDDVRVMTTKDRKAGYRLVALVRIDASKRTVERGWVMLEPLDEEPSAEN